MSQKKIRPRSTNKRPENVNIVKALQELSKGINDLSEELQRVKDSFSKIESKSETLLASVDGCMDDLNNRLHRVEEKLGITGEDDGEVQEGLDVRGVESEVSKPAT
jgi:predicted  nucleic acid-binding Zn-ribbon protein